MAMGRTALAIVLLSVSAPRSLTPVVKWRGKRWLVADQRCNERRPKADKRALCRRWLSLDTRLFLLSVKNAIILKLAGLWPDAIGSEGHCGARWDRSAAPSGWEWLLLQDPAKW